MAWSEWKKFGGGLENFTWQSGVNSFSATVGKQYYVIISGGYIDYTPTLTGCNIDETIAELAYGIGSLLVYKVTATSTQIIEKHNNTNNTHVALGYMEI